MSFDELISADATALAHMVRTKEISSRELVEASLDRIASVDPVCRAVSWLQPEAAYAAAEQVDHSSGDPSGDVQPFRGVPILLKDHRCLAEGQLTRFGLPASYSDELTWDYSSHVYQAILDLGFVVLGRSTTPELATAKVTESVGSGVTRNPQFPRFTSGGSSGGAAAAVASGMVSIAHGTDGGGSLRTPASCTGLIGLKPSRGRVSLGPYEGESWGGCTTEGFLTRSVDDMALALRGISRDEPGDNHLAPGGIDALVSGSVEGLRIGVLFDEVIGDDRPSTEVARTLMDVAGVLEDRGAHIIDTAFPRLDWQSYTRNLEILIAADVHVLLRRIEARIGAALPAEALAPRNARRRDRALKMNSTQYLEARYGLNRWTYEFCDWFYGHMPQFDVLMLPTLGSLPVRAGEDPADDDDIVARSQELATQTNYFNVSGLPAISLPLGRSTQGLPVGIQFAARIGCEQVLLNLARSFELQGPWNVAMPADSLTELPDSP